MLSRRTFVVAGTTATAGAVTGLGIGIAAGTSTRQRPGRSLAERFAEPDAAVRPSVEWFVPLTATSNAEISNEIEAMALAGIGSAELIAWAVPDADLDQNGWGSPAWNHRVTTALDTAARHGITVDLTLAPEVPLGVPSITADSPGASTELVYGHATVEGGTTFHGRVPPPKAFDISDPFGRAQRRPGTPALVAVTAARLLRTANEKPIALDRDSLRDLTEHVHGGRIRWTAPADGTWLLFGFWRRGTGQVTDGANDPVHVVDHYSLAGVGAVTRYWERHLLTPPIRDGLRRAGGCLRTDSVETQFVLPWTPGMLRRFAATRGYDLAPYLPLLFIERLHVYAGLDEPRTPNDPPDFGLSGEGKGGDHTGARIRNDFYQLLTDLYRTEHLEGLGRWARELGLRFSAALGPRMVVGRAPAAASAGEPENDRVFFHDNDLDDYRTLAGGAHLGHRRLFKSELAPVTGEPLQDAYGVTWQRMLELLNRAYASGVNHVRLHCFPYAEIEGAQWPGWSPLAPLQIGPGQALPGMAEAWGPRQPTWRHLPDITAYLARQQLVLQTGRPRVDVAIYRHSYWESAETPNPIWRDKGLRQKGFTYEFVDPALLELPTAHVVRGRLDPAGPGYRALVLDGQRTMPVETAYRILAYAGNGLPVVVVGEPPDRTPFFDASGGQDAAVRRAMELLTASPGVRRVDSEAEVPPALAALGVTPDAEPGEQVDLLTVHRAGREVDLYWHLNPGPEPIEVAMAYRGSGRAYALDAWTGTITAIPGRTVELALAPGQTAIVALAPRRLARAAPTAVRTRPARPIPLHRWHLAVEDWRPGRTASETTIVRRELDLPDLLPWKEIRGLEDVSGIGVYTTTFDLPDDQDDTDGATLHLGRVAGTVRVRVNGRRIPPVDQTAPVADLRGRVRPGRNTLEVEVATTLRNRLRVVEPAQAGTERQAYGLIGPVTVTPYRTPR